MPDDLAVAFEGEDVRADPVEVPAIMADDQRAAGEAQNRFLQRAEGFDVDVVGGLVEEQTLPPLLSSLAKWTRFRSPPERFLTGFC